MITLILSETGNINLPAIVGYIMTGCEAFIVLLTLISFFVPAESKVGKCLARILVGLYKAKNYTETYVKAKEEEEKKHNDEGGQQQ